MAEFERLELPGGDVEQRLEAFDAVWQDYRHKSGIRLSEEEADWVYKSVRRDLVASVLIDEIVSGTKAWEDVTRISGVSEEELANKPERRGLAHRVGPLVSKILHPPEVSSAKERNGEGNAVSNKIVRVRPLIGWRARRAHLQRAKVDPRPNARQMPPDEGTTIGHLGEGTNPIIFEGDIGTFGDHRADED